jgi:hypothetical protein
VRLRVGERGVVRRVHEGEVHEVPDLRLGRCVDERAMQLHALVVLRPRRDHEDAVPRRERRPQPLAVVEARDDGCRDARHGAGGIADDLVDVVAGRDERPRGSSADVTGGAGEDEAHGGAL